MWGKSFKLKCMVCEIYAFLLLEFKIFSIFSHKQQVLGVWTGCIVYAQDTEEQWFLESKLKNVYFNSQIVLLGW